MSATISSFGKWLSDPMTPATCSNCGGFSYVSHKSNAVAGIGAIAIGVIGIWAAAQFMTFYVLVAAVLLAAAWFMLIWHSAPLVKTDINRVADLMVTSVVVSLCLSVLAGIAWFIFFIVL